MQHLTGSQEKVPRAELMFPILQPGNLIHWLWFIRDRGLKGLNICLHRVVIAVNVLRTIPSFNVHLVKE